MSLAETSWRSGIDGEVTCSDASSTGGACVSTSLTSMGGRKAEEEYNNVDHGLGVLYQPVPPQNMPAVSTTRRVLVVRCFDGIAALHGASKVATTHLFLYIIGN